MQDNYLLNFLKKSSNTEQNIVRGRDSFKDSSSRNRSRSRDNTKEPTSKSPGGFVFGQTPPQVEPGGFIGFGEPPQLKSPGGFIGFGEPLQLKSPEGFRSLFPHGINIVTDDNDSLILGVHFYDNEELFDIISNIESKYEIIIRLIDSSINFRNMCVLINIPEFKFVFLDSTNEYKEIMAKLNPQELAIVEMYKKKIIVSVLKQARDFGIPLDKPFLLYCDSPKFTYKNEGEIQIDRTHMDRIFPIKVINKDLLSEIGRTITALPIEEQKEYVNINSNTKTTPIFAEYGFVKYIEEYCVSTMFTYNKKIQFRFEGCPGMVIGFENASGNVTHTRPRIMYDTTEPYRIKGNQYLHNIIGKPRIVPRDLIKYISQKNYEFLSSIPSNQEVDFTSKEIDEIRRILSETVSIPIITVSKYLELDRGRIEIGGGRKNKKISKRKISKRKISKRKRKISKKNNKNKK